MAHNTGLGANWKTRRAFWADRAANESSLRVNLLSLATARSRHVGDDPNLERHDPDLWTDEFYFLNQPGQVEIQSDLFYDYRTNVENYPKWQAWMRWKQPRLLVISVNTSHRSTPQNRKPIAATCRALKFTLSTAVISRWIPQRMRLRRLIRSVHEDGEMSTAIREALSGSRWSREQDFMDYRLALAGIRLLVSVKSSVCRHLSQVCRGARFGDPVHADVALPCTSQPKPFRKLSTVARYQPWKNELDVASAVAAQPLRIYKNEMNSGQPLV